MARYFRRRSYAAVLLFIASLCWSSNAVSQGKTSNGLSVTIRAKDRTVKSGSPVWVDVIEKNESDNIRSVGRERPLDTDQGGAALWVDVLDDKGKRPQETTFYRKKLGHITPEEKAVAQPTMSLSGILILLKPGESRTDRIDVGRLYDLSRPGTYTIQLVAGTSNKIRVTVTP